MTRYSSALYPIKVVVKAAVLQVFSLTFVQVQKLKVGIEKPASQENHHHPALDHDSNCTAALGVTWHPLC